MYSVLGTKQPINRPFVISIFLCLFFLFSSSCCPASSEKELESFSALMQGKKQAFSETTLDTESLFSFDIVFSLSVLAWLFFLLISHINGRLKNSGSLPELKSWLERKRWKSLKREFFTGRTSNPEVYRIYRGLRF